VHRRRLELDPQQQPAAKWNKDPVCLVHPTLPMPPHSHLGHATVQRPSSCCSVRDLGVYVDGAMTMRTHINRVLSSCFSALRHIKSIKRSLPTHALTTLVTALVCCHTIPHGLEAAVNTLSCSFCCHCHPPTRNSSLCLGFLVLF